MRLELEILIASVGSAGAIALMSTGLIMVYRASGILNFAHGAQATLATYFYLWLWNEKDVPLLLSIVFGVGLAVLVGASFQFFVLARLRQASMLIRVVATLGLMITIQGAIVPLFGLSFGRTPHLGGGGTFMLPFGDPSFQISRARAYVFLISVAATAILWAVYKFTRFGLLTSAAAENEEAVTLAGWSVQRLQLLNWMVGSGIAGFSGILLSTLVPVSVSLYTTMLVTAIAAAVVGRLTNFWPTYVAAVLVACAQPLIAAHEGGLKDSIGLVNVSQALPFLVIIVVVIRQGSAVPIRDLAAEVRLPRVSLPNRPVLWIGFVGVISTLAITLGSGSLVTATISSLIFGLVCLSVVLITGFVGQISLCQMALAGLGALAASYLSAELAWPFPLPILAGALLVVPVGVIFGLPAVRVRGMALAIVTMGLALAIEQLVFNNGSLTGGDLGRTLDPPSLLGIDLNPITNQRSFGLFAMVVVLLAFYVVIRVARGGAGRRMIAVRNHERAAAASGVSVWAVKIVAFGASAFLAGLAGALYAYLNLRATFEGFGIISGITVVALAGLGGMASIGGALIGGTSVTGGLGTLILNQFTDGSWLPTVAGVLLILTLLLNQDGVAVETRKHVERLGRSLRARLAESRKNSAEERATSTSDAPSTLKDPDELRDARMTCASETADVGPEGR